MEYKPQMFFPKRWTLLVLMWCILFLIFSWQASSNYSRFTYTLIISDQWNYWTSHSGPVKPSLVRPHTEYSSEICDLSVHAGYEGEIWTCWECGMVHGFIGANIVDIVQVCSWIKKGTAVSTVQLAILRYFFGRLTSTIVWLQNTGQQVRPWSDISLTNYIRVVANT